MEVLYFPFNDLARFLRHAFSVSEQVTVGSIFQWIFTFYLFIYVSVLLLLLIQYFCWKFQEADEELSIYLQNRNEIYRPVPPNKPIRRSVGSHWHA